LVQDPELRIKSIDRGELWGRQDGFVLGATMWDGGGLPSKRQPMRTTSDAKMYGFLNNIIEACAVPVAL